MESKLTGCLASVLVLSIPCLAQTQPDHDGRLMGFRGFEYPAMSPDGRRIAFFAEVDGDHDIYLMDLRSGEIERLTTNDRWDATPVWTPDGKRLVYQSEIDGNREIVSLDLATGRQANLTKDPAEDSHPKVSSDGRFIVFDSNRATPGSTGVDVAGANYEIYRMALDGSGVERLTDHGSWDTYGDLSPDGRYLAWRRVVEVDGASNSEIFWKDLETGEERNVTRHPAFDGYPDWTPDGRILFASNRAGEDELAFDVYLWDPDSERLTRLTHTAESEAFLRVTRPRATPDARSVIGSRYQAAGNHVFEFPLPAPDEAAAVGSEIRFRPVIDAASRSGGTSRGVAWGDYTGDGYADLVVSNTDDQRIFLYRNVDGQRLEAVVDSEVTSVPGRAQGVNWIDVENDGDLDLFVAREQGVNLLFVNDGEGRLERAEAGQLTSDELDSLQGCWADFDADGLLDVFVVNAAYQDDVLYRNEGNGRFMRVSGPWAGLANHGRSCAWEDIEGDGDPDLYVANAYRESAGAVRTDANYLFRNEGGGSFSRVVQGEHVNFRAYSYGVSFADFDDDGDGDLLVSSIGRFDPNLLFENVDGRLFQPLRRSVIVRDRPGPAKGHAWGDFDNDGDLDLFLAEGHGGARPEHFPFDNRDRLYEQRDGGFVVAGLPTLTAHDLVSAGSALADFDRDGDLDLFIANWGEAEGGDGARQDNQFYRNVSTGGRWIQVRLQGTRSNRMGLGARVAVTTGEGGSSSNQFRTLGSGSGFASMPEPVVHFGLGDASQVAGIEIRWPSGQVDVHRDIEAGRRYLAVEGGGLEPDPPTLPPR